MKLGRVAALLVFVAGAAQAQDSNFDLSVGLKAWRTQWTSWSYFTDANDNNLGLQSVTYPDKWVLIPQMSARYKDFVGSISGFTPTDFGGQRRKEYDANLGWLFTPGFAVSVGWKYAAQYIAESTYNMSGPTVSVSGTVPIRNGFSMYGTLGLGRLKSTGSSTVQFDKVGYQLSELGIAYGIGTGSTPKAVSLTFGYRMQVLNTKDAFEGQDARDLTQGFTFGVFAVF